MENNVKKNILTEAGRIVDGARRAAYGTPEDNFKRIANFWNCYLENRKRESGLGPLITAADVSPMMRLMKEARLCESPDHRDSFVDIIGYALTGAEINLPEEEPHWADDIANTPEEKKVLDEVAGSEYWLDNHFQKKKTLDQLEKDGAFDWFSNRVENELKD